MLKYNLLVVLVFSLNYSWAQVHPQTHQYLAEVVAYENGFKDSYSIYLGVPEGFEEAAPLHFYQPSDNGVSRLSTYYFTKRDSLITSTLHQWGNFDELFKPNLPYNKKTIKALRNSYVSLQQDLVNVYGNQLQVYEDKIPNSKLHNEIIKWQVPILYDPMLNYRELEEQKELYAVVSLSYANLGWEESFVNQAGFLQYYFFSNIRSVDYKLAASLLSPNLQIGINESHFKELTHILENFELELYNSREGFSGLEREYLFMYRLVDTSGAAKYSLNIAYDNNLDISFLQYSPIK